ncbi:FAD binding domain-containing protein [Lineolata rhizophorae]|uniref:FAD binding domain-containing protein n=1 Tax=Lineolata rhizophorae TaxID=578093 RepID=A0A6A6NSK8_9PEZI|nr:FAD binding domain-containing protein [Lineolata rhizophorae]
MVVYKHLLSALLLATNAAAGRGGIQKRQNDAPTTTWNGATYSCKCYNSDDCWPEQSAWDELNTAVDGNLVANAPAGAPCYQNHGANVEATYNQQECQEAVQGYGVAEWVDDQPATLMWPFYSNTTCEPAQNAQGTCTLGFLPEYVVMAKTAEHVQAGVQFAAEHNLRLVIRNTGHDFMGRSTGYGSLAINTHALNSIEFTSSYDGPGDWTGGAVTLGSGVQHSQLYPAANQLDPPVVVVGGECPTVGIAGGFIQGGGHGPLAGYHGLGSDQALEFKVVTADGDLTTANAEENPDLFWALKGGGPSTFGVLTSVTIKTHPEMTCTGMSVNITGYDETFWTGVADFHNMANHFTEAGMYVWFALMNGNLNIQPVVGPNMTEQEFTQVVQPFLDKLDQDGVQYQHEIREFSNFYDLWYNMFSKTNNVGDQQSLVGGRLFVAEDIEQHGDEIVDAIREVIGAGSGGFGGFGGGGAAASAAVMGGHVVNPGHAIPQEDYSATHPAWRRAATANLYIVSAEPGMSWEERKEIEDMVTNTLGQKLRDASPNSASYINEGDVNEPNWQETYWGDNYPRLLEIKQTWDPNGVFYAKSTPGTEDWEVIEYGTRLCKKQ